MHRKRDSIHRERQAPRALNAARSVCDNALMVRFGIAGFGLFAEKRLAPAFEHTRHAQLVALTRRDPQRARESAARFGVPHAFTSSEELCRCPDVDAVFVATPNACHVRDTLTALRYGRPVLCEKPMAMNAAECRRMIEAAHDAGVPLGVGQVFRFAATVRSMRARVAAGQIGTPIHARAEFCYMGRGHARTWIHDRSIAGGGAIMDVGVHCVDALRFILQDQVEHVDARAAFDDESRDVDASAVAALQFRRGALASVMVSMRTHYRTTLEIVGENGVLRANDALAVDQPVKLELLRGAGVVEAEELSNADVFAQQFDSFALAVEERGELVCSGEEGLKNQLVLDAAYAQIYGVKKLNAD